MGWQLKDGDARVITGLASQRAALGRPWLRQAARRRALVGLEPVWRPLGPVEVKKWGNDGAAVRSYLQGFPASAILVNEPRSAPLPSIRGARAGEQVTWSGHAQCPIKRFLIIPDEHPPLGPIGAEADLRSRVRSNRCWNRSAIAALANKHEAHTSRLMFE